MGVFGNRLVLTELFLKICVLVAWVIAIGLEASMMQGSVAGKQALLHPSSLRPSEVAEEDLGNFCGSVGWSNTTASRRAQSLTTGLSDGGANQGRRSSVTEDNTEHNPRTHTHTPLARRPPLQQSMLASDRTRRKRREGGDNSFMLPPHKQSHENISASSTLPLPGTLRRGALALYCSLHCSTLHLVIHCLGTCQSPHLTINCLSKVVSVLLTPQYLSHHQPSTAGSQDEICPRAGGEWRDRLLIKFDT